MDLEKKLLDSLVQIIVLMIKDFKDGVQAADFVDIAAKINANEELKKEIMEVYNNIDKVPNDVQNMKWQDGVELIVFLVPKIMQAIQEVKG